MGDSGVIDWQKCGLAAGRWIIGKVAETIKNKVKKKRQLGSVEEMVLILHLVLFLLGSTGSENTV